MTPPERFAHRHNADGTYDSICMKCFATVAHDPSDTALEKAENLHTCYLMDARPQARSAAPQQPARAR